ncbi:MAG: GNAT family N-acetyltransferase [Pseudomonadota bacterium]
MDGTRHGILPRRARLTSGHEIDIRTVQRADAGLIRDGFAHLSDRSRFLRFLGARSALSDAELDRLTDPGDDSITLGAVTRADSTPVGLARLIRLNPADRDAEIALTVVDAFQGQGAGRLLFETLAQVADAQGLTGLVALVHRSNRAMLGLLSRYGGVAEPGLEADVEIRLPVASVLTT